MRLPLVCLLKRCRQDYRYRVDFSLALHLELLLLHASAPIANKLGAASLVLVVRRGTTDY